MLILLIIIVVVAFLVGMLLKEKILKLLKNFLKKAKLVKDYWFFIVAYVMLVFVVFFLILKYAKIENVDRFISIAEHFSTMLFAIFVGYYAFLQVVENRIDKYKENGYIKFKDKEYYKSVQEYEKAFAIDSKDETVLCNLIELYIITKKQKEFLEKIEILKDNGFVEKNDEPKYLYLKIANNLIKQELGLAKEELKKFFEKMEMNKNFISNHFWDFDDIKEAEVYKDLDGESREIFKNFIAYLSGEMKDEKERKLFESGDYILDSIKIHASASSSVPFRVRQDSQYQLK